MTLKIITFKPIELPDALAHANRLSPFGTVSSNDNHFTCLSIDDSFIHKLFPYFHAINPLIQIPDYFGEDLMGAHITIAYPEENAIFEDIDLGIEHRFSILTAFCADIGLKRYYGLTVKAPTLLDLRKKYGLGKKLQFKRYLIDLHITIGTFKL